MPLRTQFFSPLCPNFVKEGGGQKARQIVLIYFGPIRGGEGRGSMNLGQTPKIFYFFFFDGVPKLHCFCHEYKCKTESTLTPH